MRISKNKAKRRRGGHLKCGSGVSLTKTSFDNGCGIRNKSRNRATENRAALNDS